MRRVSYISVIPGNSWGLRDPFVALHQVMAHG
jgi:hypothetical protein